MFHCGVFAAYCLRDCLRDCPWAACLPPRAGLAAGGDPPRQASGTAVPHAPHTLTPLQGRGRGCGPEILYVPRQAGLFHHGSIRRDVFPLSGHFSELLNPWDRIASLSSPPLLVLLMLVRWLLTIGLYPARKNGCLC